MKYYDPKMTAAKGASSAVEGGAISADVGVALGGAADTRIRTKSVAAEMRKVTATADNRLFISVPLSR